MQAAQPHLRVDSAVLRAARSFAPTVIQSGRELTRAAGTDADELLTVGELAALDSKVHLHSIRYGSLLLRAIGADLEQGSGDDLGRAALREVAQRLRVDVDSWRGEFATSAPWQPVPIRDLVRVQVESVFAAAHALGRV